MVFHTIVIFIYKDKCRLIQKTVLLILFLYCVVNTSVQLLFEEPLECLSITFKWNNVHINVEAELYWRPAIDVSKE